MIKDVDDTLKNVLEIEFGRPLPFDLSFAIPDKDFEPLSSTKETLNCYLYDIRENRELRRVAPIMRPSPDGFVEKDYPPPLILLTYCITAWSPAQATPGTAPTLDEHNLLGEVLRVLLKYPTLPEVALSGALFGQEPPPLTSAVSPDGAKNSSDFWNAIGGKLRPALEYSITFALGARAKVIGPMVHSLRVDVGDDEPVFAIGGTVYDSSAPAKGVGSAWVRIEETGQTYIADGDGRFRIGRIAAGNYKLVVRAVGFQEGTRNIEVPLESGNYDVTLIS
jgi:hypothetical protein